MPRFCSSYADTSPPRPPPMTTTRADATTGAGGAALAQPQRAQSSRKRRTIAGIVGCHWRGQHQGSGAPAGGRARSAHRRARHLRRRGVWPHERGRHRAHRAFVHRSAAPRRLAGRVSQDIEARIREEALFGRLPLLPREREYSTRGILATGFAYAVAAWCFLIGGYAANVVGAVQGVVALVAGCVIGVTMSAAASALACNRYGIEQIDFTKSCFGQNGAKIILIFYVINQIGWTGTILVMFGRGVSNVVAQVGGGNASEWVTRVAVAAGL